MIVAKSKPTLNLVTHAATSSSNCAKSNCVERPGILRTHCQLDWQSTGGPVAREHNQDAASSSQVWQEDAMMARVRGELVAAEKNQELLFWEITFHQESVHALIETVVSSNWETDHGSDRHYRYFSDRLEAANVAEDNFAY